MTKPSGTAVIVEDQEMFLGFLRKICAEEMNLRVVGTARNALEGLGLCRCYRPDLVLVDLDLPDGNALDMLPDFKTASPLSRILAVSVLVDEYTLWRVAESEVDGFVDKEGTSVEKLASAISTVMNDRSHFSPIVAEARRNVLSDPRSWQKLLTAHELGVLRLIGSGRSNEEVGGRLDLTPATIKALRQTIMAKLGLHCERDLIRFSVHKGLAQI